MPKKTYIMEFGNFICKFGRKKLLDFAESIVIPAFFDKKLYRYFGETRYFLYNVEFIDLTKNHDKPIAAICGRIIKDTILEREQVFDENKGLVKDSRAIKSSPSAIFLLILNNHRLIYIKETKDAPTKETFGNTILNFLRSKHQEFINNEYIKINSDDKKITKRELLKIYPRPSLDIIPLTSNVGIEEFIQKYNKLKKIEIIFKNRNDETDNNYFFEALQTRQDLIQSKNTKLTHYNKEGLEKEEAIKEVQEASSHGNQLIKLSGIDEDGDKLDGNNEEFQLKKSIVGITGNIEEDAANIYNSFLTLLESGTIKVKQDTTQIKDLISTIIGKLK